MPATATGRWDTFRVAESPVVEPGGLDLEIPGRAPLRLRRLLLDFNGTLACTALHAADPIAPDIGHALDLLLLPQRLVATLRA